MNYEYSAKKTTAYEELLQRRNCDDDIDTPKFGGWPSAFEVLLGESVKYHLEAMYESAGLSVR